MAMFVLRSHHKRAFREKSAETQYVQLAEMRNVGQLLKLMEHYLGRFLAQIRVQQLILNNLKI